MIRYCQETSKEKIRRGFQLPCAHGDEVNIKSKRQITHPQFKRKLRLLLLFILKSSSTFSCLFLLKILFFCSRNLIQKKKTNDKTLSTKHPPSTHHRRSSKETKEINLHRSSTRGKYILYSVSSISIMRIRLLTSLPVRNPSLKCHPSTVWKPWTC